MMNQTETGKFIALKKKDDNNITKNVILSILFSVTLLVELWYALFVILQYPAL